MDKKSRYVYDDSTDSRQNYLNYYKLIPNFNAVYWTLNEQQFLIKYQASAPYEVFSYSKKSLAVLGRFSPQFLISYYRTHMNEIKNSRDFGLDTTDVNINFWLDTQFSI